MYIHPFIICRFCFLSGYIYIYNMNVYMHICIFYYIYIHADIIYTYICAYIYIYVSWMHIYINILEFCKPLIGRCDSPSYPTSSHFLNPEIPKKLKFWQYLCMYICVYMYTHINRAAIKRNCVFTYLFLFYTDFQHQTSYIYIKLSYIYIASMSTCSYI